MDRRIEIEVRADENKKRLEDLLLDRFRSLSKLYLRKLVKQGKCEVNGRLENRGYRLRENDFIEIHLDPDRQNSMVPEDLHLDVVQDDPEFVIVNKPVGMLVHPSHRDKSGTVLNALAFLLNRTSGASHIRPGLVHRLDRETSGLLVISKNTRSHRRIAIQFQRKQVEKKYLAMVDGSVAADAGVIDHGIGRFAAEKRWGVKADGRYAETRFRVVERHDSRTLLELEPITGRTNQLRIHCAAIGHPIIGDTTRGGSAFPRLCLHAEKLFFRHPSTWEPMTFEQDVDFGFVSPNRDDTN
jgi:23S rRNA pseudouridine1911/1915/1917 synthase